MIGLVADRMASASWMRRLADRSEQIAWVLDYWADLDADFLAVYGIDLDGEGISGPRFFALAHRLTAYTGVMAARVEEERAEQPTAPAPTTAAAPPTRRPDSDVVSLTAFQFQFPGIVSTGGG